MFTVDGDGTLAAGDMRADWHGLAITNVNVNVNVMSMSMSISMSTSMSISKHTHTHVYTYQVGRYLLLTNVKVNAAALT